MIYCRFEKCQEDKFSRFPYDDQHKTRKEKEVRYNVLKIIVVLGLFGLLAVACRQTSQRTAATKWQISQPPSAAAGYGTVAAPAAPVPAPAAVSAPEPVPERPAVAPGKSTGNSIQPLSGGYGNNSRIPAETKHEKAASGGYGTVQPREATWQLLPPPSAAGYGR